MSFHQQQTHNVPPPPSQLLLFFLLLGWLVAVSVGVGLLILFLPVTWPDLAKNLLAVGLLAGLLLAPLAGFGRLVVRRGWDSMRPLVLALAMTVVYSVAAAVIRAVTEPGSSSEIILKLAGLTLVALVVGVLGLRWADLPGRQLLQVFGLGLPSLAGLLLALALAPLLTIGWPVTGALGDRWTSLLIAGQTLAVSLPEEVLFRGAILGLLLSAWPPRRGLALLVALLIFLAFTPSLIIPRQDWGQLALLVSALPLALLLIELRLLTGTIWAGLLVAWAYQAAPLLFTDPRVELPLITQPWQTAARIWLLLGAGVVALLLAAGQRFLASRWQPSALALSGVAAGAALLLGGVWLGLWVGVGRPGFYDDGFLIIMAEQADLQGAADIDDPVARRAFVRDRLIQTAERTQAPVRSALEAAGLPYRPYYIIDMIRVDGHHRQMADFARLPGVAQVLLNPNVRPYPFQFDVGYGITPEEGQGVGWNIHQTGADQLWAKGVTGQGIVVGGQDTGYDWQHPALRRAYRGYNPDGPPRHDYNWHDAWDESPVPFDDDQHGTHTMGTVLGSDDHGNQIGMAPGARWIGCRNMRRGIGNPASYAECMEFFLAPYPVGGNPFSEGDVALAPQVTNNSWGCPDIEGCNDEVLEPATAAMRAAGIMMVVSAGNDGPDCRTISEPPARYGNVFSVGATNDTGQITGFSSRGPVTEPETGEVLKPDVVAPGEDIRSSLPGGGYGTASGTSMAGPHVAGLVALLWSANPDLVGQIDQTEAVIRRSAHPMPVSAACPLEIQRPDNGSLLKQLESLDAGHACACGGIAGSPNNVYGWGEIDAPAAVKLAQEQQP